MTQFTIFGVPVPKGSKTALPFRRPDGKLGVRVMESKPGMGRSRAWKDAVVEAVQAAARAGAPCLDGPLSMDVLFHLPRPASAPKRRRHPDRKPDLSKLIRAIEDPMIGVLLADDARIVALRARKVYAQDGRPRAEVSLWLAEE